MRAAPTESFLQDLRFAARMLRRSRGFTATTVVLLALGIGANTAIFSVISSVFLRPLPFPDPDRLVLLWADFSATGGPSRVEASPADYREWRARNRSFIDVAAMVTNTYSLTGSGEPEKVSGVRTTANLFSVLGTTAVIGRPLQAADDAPGATPAVVVSDGGGARVSGPTLGSWDACSGSTTHHTPSSASSPTISLSRARTPSSGWRRTSRRGSSTRHSTSTCTWWRA